MALGVAIQPSARVSAWAAAAGRRRGVGALTALFLVATAAPAMGQQNELNQVERALRQGQTRAATLKQETAALESEIQALRVESVSAARRAQNHESRLSAIEAELTALERRKRGMVADLATRRAQLGTTLAALQRIALQPPDALVFSPSPPIDTVRSGLLLRAAIPTIERRATALRAELDDLRALRDRIALQRRELGETAETLAAERDRLNRLIERKSAARAARAAEQRTAQEQAEQLAARAGDLRELLERVERAAAARAEREARERAVAERAALAEAARRARAQTKAAEAARRTAENAATPPTPAPPPAEGAPREDTARERPPAPERRVALAKPSDIRPFPVARASLTLPARGRLVVRYGQARGADGASRGIVMAARPGARVVAPYDGKVVYAGTFRSYGQILIIEHGERYHTLLAGLERIDAVVGQWLLAGEPVGVLGAPRDGQPELYFELRHAGQPVNPLPWLATTDDKVRG